MLDTTADFRLALAAIFSTGWRIATSMRIPGTNINIPEFAIACLFITVVLRHVPRILGLYPWADHDIVHPEFMDDRRNSYDRGNRQSGTHRGEYSHNGGSRYDSNSM